MFSRIFVVATFQQIGGLTRALVIGPWQLDHQLDVEIAARVSPVVGDSFAFEAQLLPALASLGNLQFDLAARGWHGNRRAAQGFPHCYRELQEEVLPLAFQIRMRAKTNDQIQIPSRSAGGTNRPFSAQTDSCAFIDSGGNFYREALRGNYSPTPSTPQAPTSTIEPASAAATGAGTRQSYRSRA